MEEPLDPLPLPWGILAALIAVTCFVIALSGCAVRKSMYQVCFTGSYSGDQVCGKPMTKVRAEAEAKSEGRRYVTPQGCVTPIKVKRAPQPVFTMNDGPRPSNPCLWTPLAEDWWPETIGVFINEP